jgi:SAM-dependent methyltransferase
VNPLQLYAAGLDDRAAAPTLVRFADGTLLPLELSRWAGGATAADEALLRDLQGPVLDVGCGPGRHLHALARRGVFALGVDLSAVAVSLARDRGGRAIVADVFDELPGAGRWRTALLLDGNVGIGGEPQRLLRRIAALLHPDGVVVCELAPPGSPTGPVAARLERDGTSSSWFPWARVAADDLGRIAGSAGFAASGAWAVEDRWFASLTRSR